MFSKAVIALLAVPAMGFAPLAPRSAVRTTTSLDYTIKLVSEDEGIDETIECADDVFIVDAAEEAGIEVLMGYNKVSCCFCS